MVKPLHSPLASGMAAATAVQSQTAIWVRQALDYLALGLFFGVVLTKGEIISWFRIQEMFRFQSFHMYGIIGSAVAVAGLWVWLIPRSNIRTLWGEPIRISAKPMKTGRNQLAGGILFGLGCALVGACPGPIYALIGNGLWVMLVALLSALAAAWGSGTLAPRLLH